MLNQETKSALVNMAMDAENLHYCPEIMNCVLTLIESKTLETRLEIMAFLLSVQGAPLRLYFELMRHLPSVSNEPFISFTIK